MTNETSKCMEVQIIKIEALTVKPIDLTHVGHLQLQPTFVNCPACEAECLSVVRLEAVTCLQRLLQWTKCGKSWQGRLDCNHYCAQCGCYIGRHLSVGCSERCLSRAARKQAAVDEMSLRTKPRDCAVYMQQWRARVQAQRAQSKAERQAKRFEQQQQQQPQTTLLQAPNADKSTN